MKTNSSRRVTKVMLPVLLLFVLGSGLVQAQYLSGRSSRSTIAVNRATQTAAQSSSAPVDKETVVFGTKIHYLEAGSGPTVILLHGLGGSTQNWALNISVLAQKFRVIVPDQIGFGKSDKPFINYRIGTYVDYLDQFCKQLKIERASLVGNSMGGWIAAAYAIAFPDRVERLVLVDAAGYAPPANFDHRILYGLNPSTREGMKQVAAKVFYSKLFVSDLLIDQALAFRITAGDGYTINSMIESIIRGEDFLDNRVKSIKQPTLVLWGREDGLTPLADGERFKKEIPNSTLLVIEQCGHIPQFEKAAEFNAAVLKFLQGQ
ncbi:MAG: alpha/beta fold hydrolase [Pyrinomonadaceae bacterium]